MAGFGVYVGVTAIVDVNKWAEITCKKCKQSHHTVPYIDKDPLVSFAISFSFEKENNLIFEIQWIFRKKTSSRPAVKCQFWMRVFSSCQRTELFSIHGKD